MRRIPTRKSHQVLAQHELLEKVAPMQDVNADVPRRRRCERADEQQHDRANPSPTP